MNLDLAAENERLERATPAERLAFAVETFGEDLLFTSSFGASPLISNFSFSMCTLCSLQFLLLARSITA